MKVIEEYGPDRTIWILSFVKKVAIKIQFIDLYLFLCYDRLYDVQGQIPFDPGTVIVLF